jgi:hypothetical protein
MERKKMWYLLHAKCKPIEWAKAEFRWLKPAKVRDSQFGDGYFSLQLNTISPEKAWVQQNCLQVTSGQGVFKRLIWNRTLSMRPTANYQTTELPEELTERIKGFGERPFQQVNLALMGDSITIEIFDWPELIFRDSLPFTTEPITAIQAVVTGYGNYSKAAFEEAEFIITVEAPVPLFAQRIDPKALDFNALKCGVLSLVGATWESSNMGQELSTGDNCPAIGIKTLPT